MPGQSPTSDVMIKLQQAQVEMQELKEGLEDAKVKLENSQKSEKEMAVTLAEIVDSDGSVLNQIRMPGKQIRPPNKTPCGDLCYNAQWNRSSSDRGSWRCHANQGIPVDTSREIFLDGNDQCSMFMTQHQAKKEKMEKEIELEDLK